MMMRSFFSPNDRPGAALDTLRKLPILIRHAITIGWRSTCPNRAAGNALQAH
jgi:hypothetical protein